LQVNADEDDKASEINLCSFARPHMRAFHCAWFAFFIAFFVWFAITPLLPEIQQDLNLTKKQVWTSSIASAGGTILIRLIVGPLCDKYGARILFTILLCVAAIPTACTGLVQTATGLTVLRLFIGIAGGTFVTCEYWCSRMFTKSVVGTANAMAAGWGNLGFGCSALIMGSGLFPLFQLFYNGDSEKAWRTVCIVPAFVAFVTGIVVYRISDDAPKGQYADLKKHGVMQDVVQRKAFMAAARDFNTWIMAIQYAACFGVELTMNNATQMYFIEEFGQSTASAAALASIFGWMNIFARGLGGVVSDLGQHRFGMRGRLWAQAICLLMEGALFLVFAKTQSLAGAVVVLVFFSLFVQAAEGTSFAIVPYIVPQCTGFTSGIIGAGGNVGAVCFGLLFRQLDYESAFEIMGATILGSAVLTILINIKGRSSLFWGQDHPNVDNETGEIKS
jgi:MFS transporter, NNP family, nitrate/nitrite transporter